MDPLAKDFLYAGSIVGILGVLTLTILQLMLVGKQKSLFSFLSVLFVLDNKLSDSERLIKKIGIYLSLAGSATVLVFGLTLWFFG